MKNATLLAMMLCAGAVFADSATDSAIRMEEVGVAVFGHPDFTLPVAAYPTAASGTSADAANASASATSATASAAVTATPAQNGAEVEITVTAPNGTKKNVVNGQTAALATGANVIAVTVTNGNAVKVYTVTVTRAAS
jgi:hypothetical protein